MFKLTANLILYAVVAFAACSPKAPAPNANGNSKPSGSAAEEFGLPEATRKQICEELFRLDQEAFRKSCQQYPSFVRGEQFNGKRMNQRMKKRAELVHKLFAESAKELGKKYNLTPAQLASIQAEGIEKEWVKPPRLPPEFR